MAGFFDANDTDMLLEAADSQGYRQQITKEHVNFWYTEAQAHSRVLGASLRRKHGLICDHRQHFLAAIMRPCKGIGSIV